jgi:hypothetical protein
LNGGWLGSGSRGFGLWFEALGLGLQFFDLIQIKSH